MDKNIFRAYDVRGDVRTQLTPEAVLKIGRALTCSHFHEGETVLVASDSRTHSPILSQRLIQGLNEGGVNVVSLGQTTTPMLYFALRTIACNGGIMITGSHNPVNENGLKMCIGTRSFERKDILALYDAIDQPVDGRQAGTLRQADIFDSYCEAITSRVKLGRALRVVVDAGNGVAGPYITGVLDKLGCQFTPLFCEPDGTFPNHHPDPSIPENLADCRERVLREHADLGIAFDGDGDRLGVIDRDGQIIPADKLLVLFARSVLAEAPASNIIGDVKCSKFTFDDIQKHGGTPHMSKTGHALIKAKMIEIDAALAGEMSGHFFFSSRWFGFDDAIYAAARLLEIKASSDVSLGDMLSDLPSSYSTPELRMDCPDDIKFDLTKALVAHYEALYPTNTIDGARVDFPHGWALMRSSNTQPVLVVRVEADSAEQKAAILGDIADSIRAFSKTLGHCIDTTLLTSQP